MRRSSIVLLLLSLCLLLSSGCASMRALIPGGVSASDAEWSGIKSGQPISIIATISPNPQVTAATAVLAFLGQSDPIGVLLPVSLVGETSPRYILCTEEFVTKCQQIPLNAEVHFAGSAVGPGLLWRPKRLTAANFND